LGIGAALNDRALTVALDDDCWLKISEQNEWALDKFVKSAKLPRICDEW